MVNINTNNMKNIALDLPQDQTNLLKTAYETGSYEMPKDVWIYVCLAKQ